MIALFLLLWICFAGALLARGLDETSKRFSETLALGAAVGLAVFAAVGFVIGWAFGMSAGSVTVAALSTMAIGVAFGAAPASIPRPGRRPALGVIVLCALSTLMVVRLADRTLFESATGIATADRHNFGDLPFHMAIAAGFAWGDNFPPEHPELAGVALTYPFFGDLICGMLLAAGASWRDAFFWPT